MPELPEVETTRRGIARHLEGQVFTAAAVRQRKLRWPVPALGRTLPGQRVHAVQRRAKYLLLRCDRGTLIVHLGMSGSLRVLPAATPPGPHDHVDLLFGPQCLRLRDPRRFGAVLWTREDPARHPLLRGLGPEPLDPAFDADYLYGVARRRRVAIKSLIMDGKVVVGVGNIYATESLFLAGIRPDRAANRVSRARIGTLVEHIRQVLQRAIAVGGTTLRDFRQENGKPGYFRIELAVYGRAGEPCPACGRPLSLRPIGQRASVFCARCQR